MQQPQQSFLVRGELLYRLSLDPGMMAPPIGWAEGVTAVAPVRSTLIAKGMIYSPAHGDTAFTVPLFDGFMKRTMPEWN